MAALVSALCLFCGIALAAEDGASGAEHTATELSAAPEAPNGPELLGKRTATSETFRLSGGKLETRIYAEPIHYRDEGGNWLPIDEGLERSNGVVTNGDNQFDVRLPAQIDDGAVRLSTGDEWVSYRLLGLSTDALRLPDDEAIYETSETGTTFELSTLPTGLKEEIILDDASQPASYSFLLDASAGVVPKLVDGSIEFRDGDGKLVATMPAPTVAEGKDKLPSFDQVAHFSLEDHDQAGWLLKLDLDQDWLEQPERSSPIRIDPTVVIWTPNNCVINSKYPYSNTCGYSGYPYQAAYATYSSSGDEIMRGSIGFDLSSIPKDAYVANASIGIYSTFTAKNTSGLDLHQLLESSNGTVTWNCRVWEKGVCTPWSTPGGLLSPVVSSILTSSRGSQPGWWTFTDGIAPLVRSWLADSGKNFGAIFKLKDEAVRQCGGGLCSERNLHWNSSAAPETEKRPYISVEYYGPAPATSKLVSPSEGMRTARRLKLQSTWQSGSGTTGVTYQWKPTGAGTPGANQWQTIPANLVKDVDGKAVSWPIAVGGLQSAPTVFFDAAKASDKAERDGETIYIRALFEGTEGTGGSKGYSEPVSAVVDPAKGNVKDATAAVGPGTLDLATGNFKLTATDVSIPGPGGTLEFSRSINSREDSEYSPMVWGSGKSFTVLGGGWQPSVPVEVAGGAAWRSARDVDIGEVGSYTVITDLEGGELPFEWNGSAYVTPDEAAGWVLSRQSQSQITLRDPSGGATVFSKGSGSEYLPASVWTPGGSGNKTRMMYDLVGGSRRLSLVIAPSAPWVSCSDTAYLDTGCRVLSFHYKPATDWGAPANWYGDRLWAINYWGPDPGHADVWRVAQYDYNSEGRLKAVWDPRISPELKTEYTYAEQGRGPVATLKPPGQEPWEMKYTERGEWVENPTVPGWNEYISRKGWWRLEQVKRKSLLASPYDYAATTIAYDVPVTGSGAPYDLSGSTVAKWAQEDIPTDATAIFPPDEVPSSSPPSAYTRATAYYMNAEGQLVNTATPSGAGTSAASISTVEPDEHGNVLRELTPQNRLRALAAGSSTVETAAKARELDTHRVFNAEGTEMLEEWGPLHQVQLESGATEEARLHRTVQYDQGAPTPPAGTPMPHLPTRETTGASIKNQGVDADQRVTETIYDWGFRKPTDTVVDPNGLNIRHHTSYDQFSGLPIEIRQPKGPNGGDAHTTEIIYYKGTLFTGPHFPACYSIEKAGLPCKVLPAAQPGTAEQPDLLVRHFLSYSPLGQPTEIVESPGGSSESQRTTSITYDGAGRQVYAAQTGGGAPVPPVITTYSSTNGMPGGQRFDCVETEGECESSEINTTFDELGRVTSYSDADGSTSTTSYDLLGRPVATFDGKGTQTRKYDSVTGLLVELEDSAAGTFTASYDADGNMVERGLPNGLVAETTYGPDGSPDQLTYTKMTNCASGCTWLQFSAERSIYGQVLAQSSTLSSQQYSYDKAGRLELVKDTPQGGSCTTRSYSYDADSNRTALVTRSPGLGGACDTTSGGWAQTYGYDKGDRLIGTGIVYDDFGRITSLHGDYAGGKTLTTSYYSNEMVASQSQDGLTNTYQLDSASRPRQREQTGSKSLTEIMHYAGPSDSPAWTDRGTDWTRNIVGIGGELAAVDDSESGTSLQLVNLHGDITATASLSESATELTATFEADEFGNPKQPGSPQFGWLGGKQRRTELPSGVIQMGVRSYVPALGRFLSVDPVLGGSANTYDYANQDPLNQLDLLGLKPRTALGAARRVRNQKQLSGLVPNPFGPIGNAVGSFAEKLAKKSYSFLKVKAKTIYSYTTAEAQAFVDDFPGRVEHWERRINPLMIPNFEQRMNCLMGGAQNFVDTIRTFVGNKAKAVWVVGGCLQSIAMG